MKPTDEELEAIASVLHGCWCDVRRASEGAERVWRIVAPLVLERAAREFDKPQMFNVVMTAPQVAKNIRALKETP